MLRIFFRMFCGQLHLLSIIIIILYCFSELDNGVKGIGCAQIATIITMHLVQSVIGLYNSNFFREFSSDFFFAGNITLQSVILSLALFV